MPLPVDRIYTSEDYWNLEPDRRAELIDGKLYDMAAPDFIHQKLVSELLMAFKLYVRERGGRCEVLPAPFAVNLDAEDKNWVEPDISVICDSGKIGSRGCIGAPDLIIEVVSPSTRRHDYNRKNTLYTEAGVREYWIVDPQKERATVYYYDEDGAPVIYPFDSPVPCGIFEGLEITIADILR